MLIQVSIESYKSMQEQKIVQPHETLVKHKKDVLQEVISSWLLNDKPDSDL